MIAYSLITQATTDVELVTKVNDQKPSTIHV